jgi:hypothetical protein
MYVNGHRRKLCRPSSSKADRGSTRARLTESRPVANTSCLQNPGRAWWGTPGSAFLAAGMR